MYSLTEIRLLQETPFKAVEGGLNLQTTPSIYRLTARYYAVRKVFKNINYKNLFKNTIFFRIFSASHIHLKQSSMLII